MIYSLEYLDVQLTSRRRVERHAKCHKGVGKTLNTETDWTVTHVAVSGFDDGVVVPGNHL